MDSLIITNLRQRPVRTAVSVMGVSLGVILITLIVGLANGLMRDYTERQTNVDAEIRFMQKGSRSYSGNALSMPVRYADAILNGVKPSPDNPDLTPIPPITGVTAVAPVGEWVQPGTGGIGLGQIVDGIDYDSFIKTAPLNIIQGRGLGQSGYEVMVDKYHADHDNLKVGGQVSILDHNFTIVGIYNPAVLARIKIPLKTLQELLGGTDNCTFFMIKTSTSDAAPSVKEALEKYYPDDWVLLSKDLPAFYSQPIGPVQVFLDVVIGLSVVISTLVIMLAMYTTITERTREIGILKSLGASNGFIISEIEREAIVVSAMGVLLGFIVSAVARNIMEAHTTLQIEINLKWLIIAGAIGLIAGVVGAFYPALTAARLDPIEALSYE